MIENEKQYNNTLDSAEKKKNGYKNDIQESLEFFVNEYNHKLTYNSNSLKRIITIVGKDIVDLRQWIFNYTNITKVNKDFIHFETDDFQFVKDENGKPKKVFTLKFKENYTGQKWFETSAKTDKQAIAKELDDNRALSQVKALFKTLTDSASKVTIDCKPLANMLQAYQEKLKQAIEASK